MTALLCCAALAPLWLQVEPAFNIISCFASDLCTATDTAAQNCHNFHFTFGAMEKSSTRPGTRGAAAAKGEAAGSEQGAQVGQQCCSQNMGS